MFARINKWLAQYKKYLFSYKDGFWEFPCLYNSPDAMVATLAKMPFNKHDSKSQTITTNSPFLQGVLHYQEIETGLWIQIIDASFKANVAFKLIYDDNPMDYYSAGYYVNKQDLVSVSPTMNGIKYYNKTFTFNKPGVSIDACYPKGTDSIFICIYFDKNWFDKNILTNQDIVSSNLRVFLKEEQPTIVWPDLIVDETNLYEKIFEIIQVKGEKGTSNVLQLKINTIDLIFNLFKKIANIDLLQNQNSLSNFDRKYILKAEKILIENLQTNFPGIENIANEIGVSPTKLKQNFKQFFGQTLFDFYQEKQMQLAKISLLKSEIKIKELASNLGYENASKFAKTFKKIHGILPSDLK